MCCPPPAYTFISTYSWTQKLVDCSLMVSYKQLCFALKEIRLCSGTEMNKDMNNLSLINPFFWMTTSMIKTGQITQSTLKLLLELCLLNYTSQRMSYKKATCVYDCVCVHCTMGEERIHFCWTIIHTFWWSVDMMISKLERKLKKLLYAGNKAMTPGKNIFLYSSYSRRWEREKYIQKLLHMKYSMIRRIWEN